ncbi:SPL family radical SAM protein [Alicyclobacillus fastidiosus]|uniref:Radical SAM protein n=1 Tax=Alicyclobacillus fastidiosus TaxID=392011 RepID=A0ABV5ABW4_9BACL|nr:radical SAM protein [Alicyclobacillus fastidiosus]WEH10282.1 radical SAM protein [Alicyclobacillus fastidiosus]
MRTPPTFENISAKQVMNKVTSPAMPFRWSLNPYRGCTHGCSFCYARTTHTFMGMTPDDSFRQHIFIKENAADVLEVQLARKLKAHRGNYDKLAEEVGLLNIGTATDPYQPIEARRRETRKCLEVLARYRVPTSITTRSPLILRDLDVLQNMDIHSVNISVNTLDKAVWRNLEPATPAPAKRLETVRTLTDASVPAGILMAPILPFLTDSNEQLHEVISAAAEHHAAFLIPSVLRLNPEVKTWFLRTIDEHYPELTAKYRGLFRGAYAPQSYVQPLMQCAKALMHKFGLSSGSTFRSLEPRFDRTHDTTGASAGYEGIAERSNDGVQLPLPI